MSLTYIIAIYKHRLIKKKSSRATKKYITNVKCTFSDEYTKRNIRSSQWNAHVTSLSLHFISISITFNATISFYCLNFPTFSICTSSFLCGLKYYSYLVPAFFVLQFNSSWLCFLFRFSYNIVFSSHCMNGDTSMLCALLYIIQLLYPLHNICM